jgi:hypothetical protein
MIPAIDRKLRRRLSWTIFLLACLGFLSLGLAEQGSRGPVLKSPPPAALPFPRHQVLGLDLRSYSSLGALEWLNTANAGTLPLIAIPVDADVVAAFGEPDIQDAAVSAMDQLVTAGAGSPLAACLRRPSTARGATESARIALEAIIERYPNVLAYVSACDEDDEWQQAISDAMSDIRMRAVSSVSSLVPVSAGAPLDEVWLDGPTQLSDATTPIASTDYSVLVIPISEPVTTSLVEQAQATIISSAQTALIMLRPEPDAPHESVVGAIQMANLGTNMLPVGFTNATAPFIVVDGDWQATTVGTVAYMRTSAESAMLVVDFIGTDVHLLGVRSPQGGKVSAWIDPSVSDPPSVPDVTVDFRGQQARDTSEVLFQNLPAARHRLYVVAHNEGGSNVTLSGFFVVGMPSPTWTGTLAAALLLLIATVAFAERCHASVMDIRRKSGMLVDVPQGEHPRGFSRRR